MPPAATSSGGPVEGEDQFRWGALQGRGGGMAGEVVEVVCVGWGWCRCITVACWWLPMPAGTIAAKQDAGHDPQCAPQGTRGPAQGDGVGGDGDAQGRFVGERVLRRVQLLAGREQVPSSPGPGRRRWQSPGDRHWRGADPPRTRSATTAPASTVRWPTPVAGHAESTPPEPNPTCRPATEVTAPSGYRGLTVPGSRVCDFG